MDDLSPHQATLLGVIALALQLGQMAVRAVTKSSEKADTVDADRLREEWRAAIRQEVNELRSHLRNLEDMNAVSDREATRTAARLSRLEQQVFDRLQPETQDIGRIVTSLPHRIERLERALRESGAMGD